MSQSEIVLILDFGSQYTQLIARRIREHNVFCEIVPYNHPPNNLDGRNIKGVVLSGGPNSVLTDDAYFCDDAWLRPRCSGSGYLLRPSAYGQNVRWQSRSLGVTRVWQSETSRYEQTRKLFGNLDPEFVVWMSHGDSPASLPNGFSPDRQYGFGRVCRDREFGYPNVWPSVSP